MSFTISKSISSPDEIKNLFPNDLTSSIKKHQEEIKNILSNKDNRLLLIVGPCSAWPDAAVIKYAKELALLAQEVSDKIKIVMRVYTQKPRTTVGWSGCISQPDPFKSINIEEGIKYTRQMMLEVAKFDLAIADEVVIPEKYAYLDDLLSWIAIGARTAESQPHRLFASGLAIPVGFKNATTGNVEIAVNGIIAANHEHEFLFDRKQVKTSGNSFAHLILRGGDGMPNYDVASIKKSRELLLKNHCATPALIIDASHDNCLNTSTGKKECTLQPTVILDAVKEMKKHPEVKEVVKGFMVESFLKEGNQKLLDEGSLDKDGLSITDPCLGWDDTKKLIIDLYDLL